MDRFENLTVADIAASSFDAVRVFEKHGIDYCCGGKRSLAEVCFRKGQDATLLRQELEAVLEHHTSPELDWKATPLRDLIRHIVVRHHAYLRHELPAIQARLDKVYRVYHQRYGSTLTGLPEAFAALRAELEPHLDKEEAILFPAIGAIESAAETGAPLPRMPFGSIANPIRAMEAEHGGAGESLQSIRQITRDFELPAYACVTYRALMSGLAELEQDVHLHIHLENNVLFPRAEMLENMGDRRDVLTSRGV